MTPDPTPATATVSDVTMRFRQHTALDGVTTSFERDGTATLRSHAPAVEPRR